MCLQRHLLFDLDIVLPKAPKLLPSQRIVAANEAGGLSGKPLTARADAVLVKVVKASKGRVPVIGVGGIMSVADAQRKLDIGASLVQIYTGMLYRGPGFVGDLVRGVQTR